MTLGGNTDNRHLDDGTLHAYAADEVDPTQRAVIERHLDRCASCRTALGRVGAVAGLMRRMAPVEPDDLSWRRMQERVRERLEKDAKAQVTTLDLVMGRRWVTAGIAAVAAVALLVWFTPPRRPAPRRPVVAATPAPPEAQVVTSGDAPLDVRLATGARLRLAERSRLVASPGADGGVSLDLQIGALDVRLPERPTPLEPFEVRTPAFSAWSRSRDFSVGYRADKFLVAVREGEVDVEGEAFGGRDTVVEGERREVRIRADVEEKKTVAIRAPARSQPAPKPDAVPEPEITSSRGETKVEVVAPDDDPVAERWRQASRAYYRDRDLNRAIEHAEAVVAEGGDRAEGLLARRLICDARIALEQPNEAIKACGALLDHESGDEERRAVHYMLATIHRTQLGDCRRANEQYAQVLLYGRGALLDDEARLFRAGCSLDLGDLESAQKDIRALAPHAARLSRPAELRALESRLKSAIEGQGTKEKADE
ncbi:MAG: FecR domain-containing protein [Deltaproteobacteria bacterium]